MSETDDTDDLLLIPPDFFVLDSEFEDPYSTAPYYKLVDTLITQVHQLEDRINYIEQTTENSIIGSPSIYSSLEKLKLMSDSRNSEKFQGDNEGFKSTQSTPQKPRTIFKLNSLPSTPSSKNISPRVRRKVVGRSPQRGDHNFKDTTQNTSGEGRKSKILNDIDEFVKNVKTLKRLSAAKNLERQFEENGRDEVTMENFQDYGESCF